MIHRFQKSKQFTAPTGEVYEAHDITDAKNFVLVQEIAEAMAHRLDGGLSTALDAHQSREKRIKWEQHEGHTYLAVRQRIAEDLISLGVIHKAVSHQYLSAGIAQFTGIIDRMSLVEIGASDALLDAEPEQVDDVTAVMKFAALSNVPPGAFLNHPGNRGAHVLAARMALAYERPWLHKAVSVPFPPVGQPVGFYHH